MQRSKAESFTCTEGSGAEAFTCMGPENTRYVAFRGIQYAGDPCRYRLQRVHSSRHHGPRTTETAELLACVSNESVRCELPCRPQLHAKPFACIFTGVVQESGILHPPFQIVCVCLCPCSCSRLLGELGGPRRGG